MRLHTSTPRHAIARFFGAARCSRSPPLTVAGGRERLKAVASGNPGQQQLGMARTDLVNPNLGLQPERSQESFHRADVVAVQEVVDLARPEAREPFRTDRLN
jgi:hypothetical protein